MIEFRWSRSNNPYILAAFFAFFIWVLSMLATQRLERVEKRMDALQAQIDAKKQSVTIEHLKVEVLTPAPKMGLPTFGEGRR